jgi:hypothetical protein
MIGLSDQRADFAHIFLYFGHDNFGEGRKTLWEIMGRSGGNCKGIRGQGHRECNL